MSDNKQANKTGEVKNKDTGLANERRVITEGITVRNTYNSVPPPRPPKPPKK